VYQTLRDRLRDALARHIAFAYHVDMDVVLERPPKIEMGEAASPLCFELAKRLKKAPRILAQEIANALPKIEGVERIEVAGAGYLNAYFDRTAFWSELAKQGPVVADAAGLDSPLATRHSPLLPSASDLHAEAAATAKIHGAPGQAKIIVEHTSINPNKAAHIGHVRNAVLGDTLVRILRHAGHRVQIQNYIDNTGVQVADVVIGLLWMEKRTPVSVKMMAMEPRFDYDCWDIYAKATQFFAADKAQATRLRGETLRAIEEARGEEAEVAEVVADAIVTFHLRTMARLGVHYDLLARESEILHLKFWDAAFEMLKKSGAIVLATTGKMAGCWIMPAEKEVETPKDGQEAKDAAAADGDDEENMQDKIIVRSNGTVTYVGKDIAYQLWKFGLLGKDFKYAKWKGAPPEETVWATTSLKGDPQAPNFGAPATTVYNVIDARQAYLQDVVAQGLRAVGHAKEAEQSIHFAYEIVALTPRCAAELGYELTEEEAKKPYVEVSGRKGHGVKADDLIDKLEAATLKEVQERHAEMSDEEKLKTAHVIAVGALRYFLLKFTRNSIIAFDFADALSFEGETGPYCQYAVVRIRGIRRKGLEAAGAAVGPVTAETAQKLLGGTAGDHSAGNDLWELLLLAGSLDQAVELAIDGQEPAFMATYAFRLAQAFNLFYHKFHILSEADEQKRGFLLGLTEIVERQLVTTLSLLGIEAPEKM
jgi:arginyl-tRNA synthetase